MSAHQQNVYVLVYNYRLLRRCNNLHKKNISLENYILHDTDKLLENNKLISSNTSIKIFFKFRYFFVVFTYS